MTLANQLTILRICLVPLLVILLVYGFYGWGLAVFVVAGITDALDGLVARIRHERTELGTFLDPLADKLLVATSLIVLSLPSPYLTVRIPPWIAILSISRDAGILLAVLVFNLVIARRMVGEVFEKRALDDVLVLERKEALDEIRRIEILVPVLNVHANHGF